MTNDFECTLELAEVLLSRNINLIYLEDLNEYYFDYCYEIMYCSKCDLQSLCIDYRGTIPGVTQHSPVHNVLIEKYPEAFL